MKRKKIHSLCIGASALFAFTLTTKASVNFNESFIYGTPATVDGQNGGSGFGGAWIEGGDVPSLDTITAGSLTYPLWPSAGNSAVENFGPLTANNSNLFRDANTIAFGPGGNNNPFYIGYLVKKLTDSPVAPPPGGAADAFFGLALYGPGGQDPIFIGDSSESGNFALGTAGSPSVGGEISGKSVNLGETALLLVRLDFGPQDDTISLFVNPNLALPLPAVADATKTTDLSNLHSIGILGGFGTYQYDEIRGGTSVDEILTFDPQAVTPTPDSPIGAAWVLLPCFASAVMRRYRARQA